MNLGFFTMPIHPLDKDWRLSLKEDREAFLLADELGFTEAYVGEHVTDKAENITSCIAFIAWIAAATKQIRLGTGTINMPNTHPAAVAASMAMLDHMLDGRLIFGISPGGLLSDAELFGNLDAKDPDRGYRPRVHCATVAAAASPHRRDRRRAVLKGRHRGCRPRLGSDLGKFPDAGLGKEPLA